MVTVNVVVLAGTVAADQAPGPRLRPEVGRLLRQAPFVIDHCPDPLDLRRREEERGGGAARSDGLLGLDGVGDESELALGMVEDFLVKRADRRRRTVQL